MLPSASRDRPGHQGRVFGSVALIVALVGIGVMLWRSAGGGPEKVLQPALIQYVEAEKVFFKAVMQNRAADAEAARQGFAEAAATYEKIIAETQDWAEPYIVHAVALLHAEATPSKEKAEKARASLDRARELMDKKQLSPPVKFRPTPPRLEYLYQVAGMLYWRATCVAAPSQDALSAARTGMNAANLAFGEAGRLAKPHDQDAMQHRYYQNLLEELAAIVPGTAPQPAPASAPTPPAGEAQQPAQPAGATK
ncbi:MAG: hypothetical protein HY719_15460 [Planctomycetes bacterium]|nr:hypothetical protein [Planctomycetota bacterium]